MPWEGLMWCDKHNVDHSMNRSISFAQCINADHEVWRCPRFEQINAKQKLKNNNQLNYCKNCLINHVNIECFSTKRCCKCQLATLLHGALVTQIPKIKTILGINCNIVLHNTNNNKIINKWQNTCTSSTRRRKKKVGRK